MSLLSILTGQSEFIPPAGVARSVFNFKTEPAPVKPAPKPLAEPKHPKPPKPIKPPKPKKKSSIDVKLENMVKIEAAILSGSNTQVSISKSAKVSRTTVSVLTKQLEKAGRISIDHRATPKKYNPPGQRNLVFRNKNFVITKLMQRILDAVNNGASTQQMVAEVLGICPGYPSRTLRALVDNKLIRCEANKWPREYYPINQAKHRTLSEAKDNS